MSYMKRTIFKEDNGMFQIYRESFVKHIKEAAFKSIKSIPYSLDESSIYN